MSKARKAQCEIYLQVVSPQNKEIIIWPLFSLTYVRNSRKLILAGDYYEVRFLEKKDLLKEYLRSSEASVHF